MTYKINTREVNAYFKKLLRKKEKKVIRAYCTYHAKIRPRNAYEYHFRWLFAHLSTGVSWENNVKAFVSLKNLIESAGGYLPYDPDIDPKTEKDDLLLAISCVGNYEQRHKGITRFDQLFRENPKEWYPAKGESLVECRNRLAKLSFGIRLAKTSFALEMAYPNNNEIVCLDRHILRLYGIEGHNIGLKLYRKIEKHWSKKCLQVAKHHKIDCPNPVARHIFWDRKHTFLDTRYWCYGFEKNPPIEMPLNFIPENERE